MIRGRLVTVTILVIALLAASYAWWHQYQRGQRVIRFYGAPHAARIRLAEECELWLLAQPPNRSLLDATAGEPESGAVVRRKNLVDAKGLVHARQALIQDVSYNWTATQPTAGPQWSHVLRFTNEEGETRLLFDLEHAWLGTGQPRRVVSCLPIADGLRRFFAEQLDES